METNKTVMIIVVVLLVLLLGYGIYNNSKKTDGTSQNDKKTANGTTKGKIWNSPWFWIPIVALVGVGVWIYKSKDSIFAVKSMTSDEQQDLVLKKNLIFKEGFPGYHDENGDLQLADGCAKVIDKRLHCDRISGAEFMMYDAILFNPLYTTDSGIHTFNVQLNRDKREIEGGSYTMFRNTNHMEFIQDKSYLKKLPQAHPQSENMRMAAFAAQEDVDISAIERLQRPVPAGDSTPSQDYLYSQDENTDMDQDSESGQMDTRPRRTVFPKKKSIFSRFRRR